MKNEVAVEFISQSDGLKIAYRKRAPLASANHQCGILFLGGFATDMEGSKAVAFDQFAKKMGAEYVRFDYRGHGQSEGDFIEFSIQNWLDDAQLMLSLMQSERVIVIGSSMGGWIASLLAKEHSERVAAFIGIAAAPDFTEDGFWAGFNQEQRQLIETGGIVEVPSGYEAPYRISATLIQGSRDVLVLRSPLKLPMPVFLFQGSDDNSVSEATALKLFHHIDGENVSLEFALHADHSFSRVQDLEKIFEKISKYVKL